MNGVKMTNLNLRAIKVRELKAGMMLCLNNFRYAKVDEVKRVFSHDTFVTINGIMDNKQFPGDDYVIIVSDEPIGEPVEIVTAETLMDGWFVFYNFGGCEVSSHFGRVSILNVERPLIEGDESVFVIQVGWYTRTHRVSSSQRFMVLSR